MAGDDGPAIGLAQGTRGRRPRGPDKYAPLKEAAAAEGLLRVEMLPEAADEKVERLLSRAVGDALCVAVRGNPVE